MECLELPVGPAGKLAVTVFDHLSNFCDTWLNIDACSEFTHYEGEFQLVFVLTHPPELIPCELIAKLVPKWYLDPTSPAVALLIADGRECSTAVSMLIHNMMNRADLSTRRLVKPHVCDDIRWQGRRLEGHY